MSSGWTAYDLLYRRHCGPQAAERGPRGLLGALSLPAAALGLDRARVVAAWHSVTVSL